MKKEIVALIEDEVALEVLRKRLNVEETKFQKGLTFVQNVLDGETKNKAYVIAFGVDTDTAKKVSSQFHRGKWIQALIAYLRPEEDSLYIGEIKTIIAKGMEIIKNPRASAREKTEAMKALQPYIKAERVQLEVDVDITDTTGASIVSQLTDKIALLANNGKMVGNNGEVIDVKPIE